MQVGDLIQENDGTTGKVLEINTNQSALIHILSSYDRNIVGFNMLVYKEELKDWKVLNKE